MAHVSKPKRHLLPESLRKLSQHISQFFRLASIRGVGCLYIPNHPFHAAFFHKHVLQRRRQGLVLQASDERNLAPKLRLCPGHSGGGGLDCAHSGWPEQSCEISGFTIIKVVEENISRTFDRALIGGWLDGVFISRYINC